MNERKTILIAAFVNRALVFVIAFATHTFIRDYDLSSPNSIFNKWDSVYFVDIATNGYKFEHELAFYPGLPLLMRLLMNCLKTSSETAGLFISSVCFVCNSILLFELTQRVGFSKTFAFQTSILWCISPISIFCTAPYTESLFSLLSFATMFLWTSKSAFTIVPVLLAGFVRSNGALLGGLFLVSAYRCMYPNKGGSGNAYLGFFEPLFHSRPKINPKFIIFLMETGTCLMPTVLFTKYAKHKFCPGVEWCNSSPYSYVQSKYWNVGFLRYWRPSQFFNFVLATPIYIFVIRYLIRGKSSKIEPAFLFHLMFITIFCLLFVHIQVSTRFLLSSSPAAWWALNDSPKYPAVLFCLLYMVVGTVLFVNFLPWT